MDIFLCLHVDDEERGDGAVLGRHPRGGQEAQLGGHPLEALGAADEVHPQGRVEGRPGLHLFAEFAVERAPYLDGGRVNVQYIGLPCRTSMRVASASAVYRSWGCRDMVGSVGRWPNEDLGEEGGVDASNSTGWRVSRSLVVGPLPLSGPPVPTPAP